MKVTSRKLPTRYKPDGSSSSGGFGEVIFCTDNLLARKVAIKSIQDPAENSRLKDEIDALLSMRSKHVVQVYDLIELGDEIGIVLEHIEGDDLFTTQEPRTSTIAYLKTIWQLAVGIEDIHNASIIHRDIKPNNMKLDHERILKIFDFGLSRSSSSGAKTEGFKGSKGFAAPELYDPGIVHFTSAVDVYAFGSTALFVAENKLPSELLKMPPAPLATPLTIPIISQFPALIKLIERCLSADPVLRPPITAIRQEIESQLVKGQHQALAVNKSTPYLINKSKSKIGLSVKEIGSFEIFYDLHKFALQNVVGEIYLNNELIIGNSTLPGSSVVTIGDPIRKNQRSYITVDVSRPEVVL